MQGEEGFGAVEPVVVRSTCELNLAELLLCGLGGSVRCAGACGTGGGGGGNYQMV